MQDLGLGPLLCNDLSKGKWTWDLAHGITIDVGGRIIIK
jgi:hypothetical protein